MTQGLLGVQEWRGEAEEHWSPRLPARTGWESDSEDKAAAEKELATIRVSVLGGQHLCTVNVPADSTSAFDVKGAIEKATGIPKEKQKLLCGPEILGPRSRLLISASEVLDVTLVTLVQVKTIQVFSLGGHLCTLSVQAWTSALDVKCAVQKATGIPREKQKLICGLEEVVGQISMLLYSESEAIDVTLVQVEAPRSILRRRP